MAATKMRWGDTLDDDDTLPPTTVTPPDAKGVKTITEYRKNDNGDIIKSVTRIRVSKVERKIYKVEHERRKWARFGAAKGQVAGDSVTVQAAEEIPLDRVQKKQTREEKKESDMKTVMQSSDKSAIVGSLKDMLYKRRMERQLAAARGGLAPEKPPEEDGEGGSLPTAGSKAGGYVPPSLRNRGAAGEGDSMRRREENSVRVTNLSEDTREDDLRELFSPFGSISRIYIAYDRETGENRGFAFVNFMYKDDAQRAIEKLDGYGYDNLILRVEWAQPRAERS
ncbi:hypothetical protein WJX72_000878 [[Myrmecia] bisecta]|uniref:Eukaryotic translation initiation factor 3 subunit G n=1 Tax=[Myrmecia] bisecta TaxID=41462 RepID=A0AAW1Q344_9CHLO